MDIIEIVKGIGFAKIYSVVSTIFIALIVYFKAEQKKRELYLDKYFEKVLTPYILEYKKNNTINSVKFIRKRYTIKDYYIPSYIFYLVENNKNEDLKKVLSVDYINNYPNNKNDINKALDKITQVVDFILVLTYTALKIFAFCMILILCFCILIFLIDFFKSTLSHNIILKKDKLIIIESFIWLIIMYLYYIFCKFARENIADNEYNTYTRKRKCIEKNIIRKKKIYKKVSKKYYI
ncbi:hypothetical protein ERM42_12195 [Clostridioides difficile]|uniref:hypothetical protein n=1 Tax=Clostridioides difficile TaxID=1496 RepID=UPI00094625BD|nr:hypothetical protein [Clostridioides difficile]EGT3903104.1 hypothetical protein [Clostridioides difficile]ELX4523409.1 hypothetical protein [Clostridioides difficile]MCO8788030.1 hypothetical protein [Clostridioides difficile]MCO8827977.1 hypothetical protein [Clostridioides difficile]MCW0845036.1 hypothetical protein [Clostridioides difficile]